MGRRVQRRDVEAHLLDHAAFRRNRLNAENQIDSKSVERA
jgi:hypothetical protein